MIYFFEQVLNKLLLCRRCAQMLPPQQSGHLALYRPCSHFFLAARGLGASALALFAFPSPSSLASPPFLAYPPSPAPPSPAPRHSRHLPRSFPCPHLVALPLPPAGAPEATAPRAVGLWAARGAVRSTCARGGGRAAVKSTCARAAADTLAPIPSPASPSGALSAKS